jgi:predicted porin
MNKKLLAVAVAGALAAPGVALAQSSVTISGFLKMSVEQYTIGNANALRTIAGQGTNNSQTLLADDSSRLIFNMTEDLGGGLRAIGQIDFRVTMDAGAVAANGNNHVGLRSSQWGTVFFGRQDLHYGGRESDLTAKNDLRADSISLLAYAGGGGSPIAAATRTPNVVVYRTPDWQGFYVLGAYSFNPATANGFEQDIGSPLRKGRAWNLNPVWEARNFTIGYSYWTQKADAGNAAASAVSLAAAQASVNFVTPPGSAAPAANTADQRGDRLFGSYRWGGFKIGLAWDKSKLKGGGSGTELSRRDAWSVPIEYTWGPHWIGGHYTRANDDKATTCANALPGTLTVNGGSCAAGEDKDGAKMWAIGYNYSMSKRTSVGVTYAQIKNDAGAFYTPFTANSGLAGSAAHAALRGEDPHFWSVTIRHSF